MNRSAPVNQQDTRPVSAEAFSAPAVPADAAAYPAEHPSGPGQQPGLCLHRKRRFLLPAAGRQADDRRSTDNAGSEGVGAAAGGDHIGA